MNDKVKTQSIQLDAIDQAMLTPLVQNASGHEAIEVVNWDYRQLHGGIGAGTSVYRFSGQGRVQHQEIPWSLILKILRPEGGSTEVSAWNYYKREAEAYQSSCLNDLLGGLVAPCCYGVLNHPDGTCWMWLEDIQDRFESHWPLDHYEIVARHLGHFNAACMATGPLPSWPWLSSDWLRQYVELSASAMESLRNIPENPWARRWLPPKDSDQFYRLWEQRALYFDALDRLPQTICHFDVFTRNLFARKTVDGEDQTVLLDWAFVGQGPIGADLNPLVWMSIALGGVALDKIQELEQIAFSGYLEGLRDAGWQGNPQEVRLGYTAATIRYLFPEIYRWLALMLDESLHAGMEQGVGVPIERIFDFMAIVRPFYFKYLAEARALMEVLS